MRVEEWAMWGIWGSGDGKGDRPKDWSTDIALCPSASGAGITSRSIPRYGLHFVFGRDDPGAISSLVEYGAAARPWGPRTSSPPCATSDRRRRTGRTCVQTDRVSA